MIALLAALAVGLAAAALWELAGARTARRATPTSRLVSALSGGRARSLAEAALRLDVPARLERAGLGERLTPAAFVGAKFGFAAVGLGLGLSVGAALPDRLAPVVVGLVAIGGFLAPDALLERQVRRRRSRLVIALPDALDLIATGAASGRGARALFEQIALAPGGGPLAVELAVTVAEVEAGVPVAAAVERLRKRVPGAEIGALAAALERSRRYGSPLADQLATQAAGLRVDAKRRLDERAARAAPKIQLVVALVLVPSVLLMILAAVVAHSDELLGLI
ncbi:type II secretion system F family protein [Thermoleophilia bacterium SCSIO 60948]|nr:type II secretion system F family protein [Thermoleophilia bacterium SCSIO 60948]